jgi:MoxR-like ATPase
MEKCMNAVSALSSVVATVNDRFINRHDEITSMAISVITGSNLLLIGPPGCAKSSVTADFMARMPGRKAYFSLTKGSTPQEVLGVPSISAFKKREKMEFAIADMLPDSEFVVIEEVFKGNSLTRNAILQVLNEHQFLNGGQIVECPLVFCGASSNEYPEFNEDGAFYDRFLIRHEVSYLADHIQRMEMVALSLSRSRGLARQEPTSLTLEDIQLLQQLRSQVTLSEKIDELAYHLYANLLDVGVQVGDRRFAESFRAAQANAVLHGRDALIPDDLFIFQHTVWSDPSERQAAQQAVLRTVSPETADLTQMFDELEDGFRQFLEECREADHSKKLIAHSRFCQVAEPQIDRMEDTVAKMQQSGRDTSRAVELFARAKHRLGEAARVVYYDAAKDAA